MEEGPNQAQGELVTLERWVEVRPGTVKSRLHEARRLLATDDDLAMAAGQG